MWFCFCIIGFVLQLFTRVVCYFQVSNDLVKTVVVMRNPKDMLVSLFHFYRINKNLGLFDRSWDDFFDFSKAKG